MGGNNKPLRLGFLKSAFYGHSVPVYSMNHPLCTIRAQGEPPFLSGGALYLVEERSPRNTLMD